VDEAEVTAAKETEFYVSDMQNNDCTLQEHFRENTDWDGVIQRVTFAS
jgi:hypothetical protein